MERDGGDFPPTCKTCTVRYTAPEYERTDVHLAGQEGASTESLTALSVLSTESPQHIPP